MPKITIINLSGAEIGTIDVNENEIDLVSLLPPVIDIYREQHKQIAYKILFDETILFEYNGKNYKPNYKPINISSDTKYTIIFEEPDETVFNGLDLVQLLSYIKFINFNSLDENNNILKLLIIKLNKMFTNSKLSIRDIDQIKNIFDFETTESLIDFILLLFKEVPYIFKYITTEMQKKLINMTKSKSNLLYNYYKALRYLDTIPSLINTSLYEIIKSTAFTDWDNKRTSYITKIKEYKKKNKLTTSLQTIATTKEFIDWMGTTYPTIEKLSVFNKYIKYKTKYQLLKTKLNI